MKISPRLALAAVVFSGITPAYCQHPVGGAQATALDQFSDSVQSLSARVAPAVVQIQSTHYSPREESVGGRLTLVVGKEQSIGSGIITTPDGYILTNAHVVAGAERIRVTLVETSTAEPGSADTQISGALAQPFAQSLEAKLVGVFQEMDLALIKISATGLHVLPFADYEKLRQGQVVFAFGSRRGLGNSMSMGVVSSIARQPDPDSPFIYIQTDAPINPGDSGGPLVNTAGEIVGLNTFIYSKSGGSEGIGFAIPSSLLDHVSSQLKKFGHIHRMLMGAGVQTITPPLARALGLARESGVIVTDISPGSPAETAGLKLNDIVLRLDGKNIDNLPLFMATSLVHTDEKPLHLDLLRGRQPLSLDVKAEHESHSADRIADLVDPERNQIPRLGIVGMAVTEQTAPLLPELRGPYGVYVIAISDASRDNLAGLLAGDVIHEMNGTLTPDPEDLRSRLDNMKSGDAVALFVERGKRLMYVSFEID